MIHQPLVIFAVECAAEIYNTVCVFVREFVPEVLSYFAKDFDKEVGISPAFKFGEGFKEFFHDN